MPTYVRDDPLISVGCNVKRPKAKPARSKAKSSTPQIRATEYMGYLLTRDLWKNGTGSVNYMCVVNTDANFYLAKTPESVFKRHNGQRRRCTLRHTFSNVDTLLPSLPPLMGYWV